jgi:hypothetical protein
VVVVVDGWKDRSGASMLTLREQLDAMAAVQAERLSREGLPPKITLLMPERGESDDACIARAARRGESIAFVILARRVRPGEP